MVDATIRRVKNVRLKDTPSERATLRLPLGRAAARVLDAPSPSARTGRSPSARSARFARPHGAPATVSSSTSAPGSRGRRTSASSCRSTRSASTRAQLSFATPLLLLGLLLLPLLVLAYRRLQRRPSKYAVRYTNLDVLAGVVGSTRSWRRHAGLALFLLALAALLVGFARPSMNATRRPGGGDDRARDRRLRLDAGRGRRADAARGGAEGRPRVHEGPAEALPGRRRRVLGDGRGRRARDRRPAARDRRDRLPLPAARHRDRRRDRARRRGRAGRRHRARAASHGPPRSCSSRTARRPRACCSRRRARRARSRSRSRSTRSRSARPRESSSSTASAARGSSPCRPTRRRCARSPTTTGGRFYEAESVGDLRDAYDKMGSLVSKVKRKQEVTFAFLAGGLVLLLAAAAVARRHVPEAAVRWLATARRGGAARAAATAAATTSRAGHDRDADGHGP